MLFSKSEVIELTCLSARSLRLRNSRLQIRSHPPLWTFDFVKYSWIFSSIARPKGCGGANLRFASNFRFRDFLRRRLMEKARVVLHNGSTSERPRAGSVCGFRQGDSEVDLRRLRPGVLRCAGLVQAGWSSRPGFGGADCGVASNRQAGCRPACSAFYSTVDFVNPTRLSQASVAAVVGITLTPPGATWLVCCACNASWLPS